MFRKFDFNNLNKSEISKEFEILSNAYDIMSLQEKVRFISAVCTFKTYELLSKMYAEMCTLNNL